MKDITRVVFPAITCKACKWVRKQLILFCTLQERQGTTHLGFKSSISFETMTYNCTPTPSSWVIKHGYRNQHRQRIYYTTSKSIDQQALKQLLHSTFIIQTGSCKKGIMASTMLASTFSICWWHPSPQADIAIRAAWRCRQSAEKKPLQLESSTITWNSGFTVNSMVAVNRQKWQVYTENRRKVLHIKTN